MKFVRRNEIRCSAVFEATDGSAAQPSSAEVILRYVGRGGDQVTEVLALTLGSDGVWVGDWDSSSAGAGRVDWVAHCWGGLIAATEGSFYVQANAANLTS